MLQTSPTERNEKKFSSECFAHAHEFRKFATHFTAEASEWKSENSSVVEHNLAKVGVASSNLVSRSYIKASLIGGFFVRNCPY
tara:strand:- start:421 stop:669 length:249 start_codon:yes stop_codon:yes gene_type:complete